MHSPHLFDVADDVSYPSQLPPLPFYGPSVGLLVAITREQSEAFYLGYVFRTYGTEVQTCPIGIWREAPDCIRDTRFSERRESG